jgi:uncharacterized protein involved in outer membrane biogenesis
VRKFLKVAVIAYGAYLAVALLVISPALNILPHRYLQENYGRELRTGWVLLNPFKLSLDLHDVQLSDPSGERLASLGEASADLSVTSLWQPGWVLDRLFLRGLAVDVTRLRSGQYNFSDLLGGNNADEPPAGEDAALPALTIHDVDLHAATLSATDLARQTPYTSRWNELRIRLTDLSTRLEEPRPFSVEVEAAAGGKLNLQGELSLAQSSSRGRLSVTDLDLVPLWEFAKTWVAFELRQGRASVELDYQLDWRDAPSYRISGGLVGLSQIDIVPQQPEQLPDTSLSLKALETKGVSLDSTTHAVAIDSVVLEGPAVATWLEDDSVSLQALFAVTPPESSAPAQDDASPWTLTLDKAQLRDGKLQWRSAYTDPQQLVVQPIDASLARLTWPLSGDSEVSLALSVNQQADIAASGTIALATGDGTLKYSLEGLPLAWFNPNLPKPLRAKITGGELGLRGEAALTGFAPATVAADLKVREFSARQADEEITLTSFELLHLDSVTVDMTQHTLALRKIVLDTYSGRLHIHKDGSINATSIWKQEVGDEAQEIAEELTEEKPWSFNLPLVQISDSAIDFMDESLPLQFRTVIGDLEGEVHNLGSDNTRAAQVDLAGSVDGYAPVTLKGEITPLASPAQLDLRLTFDGVDMAGLSPYSGNFAGRKIDRGLLDLDLHYRLRDNKLKGDNTVRIEKLKLGEKVASSKAMDLPLDLALAILTDADGVIDLAVPVKGDVDDPQFDIGSIITAAFLNLLTKAITAPFSLLAGLANAEEDLQRITFKSGSSTLSDSNKEKLKGLAAALNQRPKLSLVITGRLNLVADRARLQRDALKTRLLEGGLSAEQIKEKSAEWEEAIEALYESLPESSSAPAELSVRAQSTKVAEAMPISDTQLDDLAAARAVAVKLFLVSEAGLAAERAVIGQAGLQESENTFSGVELSVDS